MADIETFCQWVDKAGVKDNTDTLIMAAHEQALSTRSIEALVYQTRQKDAPETSQHITEEEAAWVYMEHSKRVAGKVCSSIPYVHAMSCPTTGSDDLLAIVYSPIVPAYTSPLCRE